MKAAESHRSESFVARTARPSRCSRGHLEALQVQQEDARQPPQHVMDPVPHGATAAAFARLCHLLILRSRASELHAVRKGCGTWRNLS